jgi:transposase
MKIFRGYEQSQEFLLPPSLDEFIIQDHEVRIINDVVNRLDLSGIRDKYNGGGAPAYDPAMMLKVLIYAYSLGIYSSRKIVQELKTDTAFMYLSAMQCPDFRTFCLFRSSNTEVLPEIFVQVVRLCASLGMVKLGHIAIDGTKLKANASVRRSLRKDEVEREIERVKSEIKGIIKVSEAIDKEEDEQYPDGDGSEMPKDLQDKEYRLKKLKEAQELLEKEKLHKINLTDPEARLMKNKQHRIEPAYNVQVAVDAQDQIIVATDVIQQSADYEGFQKMLQQTQENLGRFPDQVSADSGYFTYDNLEYADRVGVDAFIPDNMLRWLEKQTDSEKRYDKSNFQYDVCQDAYICPEGKLLNRYSKAKYKGKSVILYRGRLCADCEAKNKCTHARSRIIWRDGRESLVLQMREKLRSEHGRQTYLRRMYTVEPVFGDMKWNRNKRATNLRGLARVRVDFLLMCTAHNIRKLIKRIHQAALSLPLSKPTHMHPISNWRFPEYLIWQACL